MFLSEVETRSEVVYEVARVTCRSFRLTIHSLSFKEIAFTVKKGNVTDAVLMKMQSYHFKKLLFQANTLDVPAKSMAHRLPINMNQ